MRYQHDRSRCRRAAGLLAAFALVGTVTACSSDDGLTDERGDLNEDFGSVPGATVESPALSESTAPTGAVPPFGTVSVAEEVYPVDGLEADGGDFTSCVVDPADRDGSVDIVAVLDDRTFAFNVLQDVASAAVGADSTVVDDYEIDGSSVRGTAEFEAGSVAFDITC
jgi:hypothetical protein